MNHLNLDAAEAKACLQHRPFVLDHNLSDHHLFKLEKLIDLAKRMPRDKIEYNSGKVAIDQDPDTTPQVDLEPAQIISEIETCGAWMVIKNVESDPAYKGLLSEFIGELASCLWVLRRTCLRIFRASSSSPLPVQPRPSTLMPKRTFWCRSPATRKCMCSTTTTAAW